MIGDCQIRGRRVIVPGVVWSGEADGSLAERPNCKLIAAAISQPPSPQKNAARFCGGGHSCPPNWPILSDHRDIGTITAGRWPNATPSSSFGGVRAGF